MDISISLKGIQGIEVPDRVTTSAIKKGLYAIDPFFREGWEHLRGRLGHAGRDAAVFDILDSLTCMVFKPDAFAGRRVLPALGWLARHGYDPIGYASFTYNRNSIREDWRYQYNIATQERIDFVDRLLMTGPSLLVVLYCPDRPSESGSASECLKRLKGPSQPHLRRAGQLRFDLGVVSTFINFIHTTDESADIPRALSLYFSSNERSELITAMERLSNRSEALSAMVDRLYEQYPAHDLDFDRSLDRVERVLCGMAGRLATVELIHFMKILTGLRQRSAGVDADAFFTSLHMQGVVPELWDELVIRAELVVPNLSGGTAILP